MPFHPGQLRSTAELEAPASVSAPLLLLRQHAILSNNAHEGTDYRLLNSFGKPLLTSFQSLSQNPLGRRALRSIQSGELSHPSRLSRIQGLISPELMM